MTEKRVMAVAHSDDRAVQVRFDVQPYLAVASADELLALAKSEWAQSEEADEVVFWTAEHVPGSRLKSKLLVYLDLVRDLESGPGFECYVDEGGAIAYLRDHRPDVYERLKSDYEDILDDNGEIDLAYFVDGIQSWLEHHYYDDYEGTPDVGPATSAPKTTPVVLVLVENGLVSQVLSDQPTAVRVLVADMDAEKVGEEWLWYENVWYPTKDALDDEAWGGIKIEARVQGIVLPAVDRK